MEKQPGSDADDSSDIDSKNDCKPFQKFKRAKYLRQLRKAVHYLDWEKKAKKTKLKGKHYYPTSRHLCRELTLQRTSIDLQVSLHCRQLRKVVQEMRKACLQQNWDGLKILLGILCSYCPYQFMPVLIRGALMLLFSHPKSNLNLVQDFVRTTAGYILDEDVNKYIKILFALRKTRLPLSEKGHLLKGRSDKVTHDPEYAVL